MYLDELERLAQCPKITRSQCTGLLYSLAQISKGHFTKVYSMKRVDLKIFPGIRLIGFSCIHTV